MYREEDLEAPVLLDRTVSGDKAAAEELFGRIYEELRGMARRELGAGRGPDMLQPTALVHEAFLKLVGSRPVGVNSLSHFRALAARAMRQVLIDSVRASGRAKRGGDWSRVTLTGIVDEHPVTVSEISDALERFAEHDERAARVVVMRYFGGLTNGEIATHLGVAERTVHNDWRMARAWLRSHLA